MQSNKNSCAEEEIPEQPEQSGAHRSAKRDHVRRRRTCETVAAVDGRRVQAARQRLRRLTAASVAAGGRSAGLADPPEDWPATSPRDAAAVTPREPKSRSAILARYNVKCERPYVVIAIMIFDDWRCS